MLVGAIVMLTIGTVVVASVVLSGGREADLARSRVESARAFYAAEGIANMSMREVFYNLDQDGDIRIGSISNDGNAANNPLLAGTSAYSIAKQVSSGEDHRNVAARGSSTRAVRFVHKHTIGSDGWMDGFEAYAVGTAMHGNGGWTGWNNNTSAGGVTVASPARSGHAAINVAGADAVHMPNLTSGQWSLTCKQYIPTSATGTDTYFILCNIYNPGTSDVQSDTTKRWSLQLRCNLSANQVFDNLIGGSPTGNTLTLIRDTWVPIRVDFDLDANTQSVYYNDQLVFTGAWVRAGGTQTLACIDLFGSTASAVYYDNIQLTRTGQTVKPVITGWSESAP